MIAEAFAAGAHFSRVNPFFVRMKTAVRHHRLKRAAAAQACSAHMPLAFVDRLPHMRVALIVVNGRDRAIDRNLVKIRTAQTRKLRVEIRKQPALQQRIVGKINAGNDVSRMKCDLFGFGEKIVGIAI